MHEEVKRRRATEIFRPQISAFLLFIDNEVKQNQRPPSLDSFLVPSWFNLVWSDDRFIAEGRGWINWARRSVRADTAPERAF